MQVEKEGDRLDSGARAGLLINKFSLSGVAGSWNSAGRCSTAPRGARGAALGRRAGALQLAASGGDGEKSEAELEAAKWAEMAEKMEVGLTPPCRQPRGKWMVSLVNSHSNSSSKRWHLWEIDLRFAPGLPPGWMVPGLWLRVAA